MLRAADNEMLTRTGPGTPMGDLFRRFWLPVVLSQELPEADGPPIRVQVMGEKLLAFRDTQGRVGLIEPACAHRGASLFWGRNEQGGIRCAFHGWKYDVTGACLEMPTIPKNEAYEKLRAEIKIKAYPTQEAGGYVWAYMGPPEHMPELPQFEFMSLPPAHIFVSKKLQQCNWAQACEGALDTAHFSFLHMSVGEEDDDDQMKIMHQSEAAASGDKNRVRWMKNDGMPRFSITEHDVGLLMGAARTADNEDLYWRITQYLMPSHAFAPSTFPGENYHGQTFVPITDELCWIYCYTWNPERPLTNMERDRFARGHTVHANVDANWVPVRNRDNDYLIDREEQKKRTFTGIQGVSEQDACIQDSQGFIADRTKEMLGPTDLGIVRFRRQVLDAAKALAQGKEPRAAGKAKSYRVRGGGTVAHSSKPLDQVMVARFGDPVGFIPMEQH
jgi:phenylpropionate dioxygenase-like ring-hydroxylating dioxygenase large terminal subunit